MVLMSGVVTVDRARWLGFRWRRHGLAGRSGEDVLDDLLLLGVQDSRQAGAKQSLIQRADGIPTDGTRADDTRADAAGTTSVADAVSPQGPLVSMWSVRGAPHVHRPAHLDFVRDALAPRESDDGGADYVRAVEAVAAALGAVVTAPMSKSEASTLVTGRVPASVVEWCPPCEANHVPDGLFRAAGRQARIVLGPGEQRTTMLYPPPEHRQEKIDHPRTALLDAYFRVNGPTGKTVFRDWMGGDVAAATGLWRERADDLVRVQVGDRRCDLPEALLDAVREAPEPEGVVLLPPNDPYLRQVDRTLLVPDGDRRRQVWRALSGPGALLVDGEVAGIWRYRRTEHRLTITAFDSLSSARRAEAERSARLVAEATGDDPPDVIWD
ncbi:hypothetical protein Psi01_50430 [Planobispora siamensis]|uniref:Winged helix DNA-binding domain-containing protein n=1 Tax=Planobispora siamensis TaxID=936338 RepID=A0A8J3WM01_9ACTN|nr:hypothetical protein Psi01_50430 [Planobispora siamensis]